MVVDNTIVNVALPTMSRKLSASTQGLQWIVDAYTLVFAGLLLVGGNLGDRLGLRRVCKPGWRCSPCLGGCRVFRNTVRADRRWPCAAVWARPPR